MLKKEERIEKIRMLEELQTRHADDIKYNDGIQLAKSVPGMDFKSGMNKKAGEGSVYIRYYRAEQLSAPTMV